MSVVFNPLTKKIIELGYMPIEELKKAGGGGRGRLAWVEPFRKNITKQVFECDDFDTVSIFVKPWAYMCEMTDTSEGGGGESLGHNVIEYVGVIVLGGTGEDLDETVIVDAFLKDFSLNEARSAEEAELFLKAWNEFSFDLDEVIDSKKDGLIS